jgi:hypothetical protein
MDIPISKAMYLEYKKAKKQDRRRAQRHQAASTIQSAVLAWLYAPPNRARSFLGGPLYRKMAAHYQAPPETWEEWA